MSNSANADTPTPGPSRKREGNFASVATRLAGLAGAILGWRPDAFWNATPAELATILAALSPAEDGIDAGDLRQLMEQFPDG